MFSSNKKSPRQLMDDTRDHVEKSLADLIKNKDSMTPQQQDELKQMIAMASIAGSTLKAAQAVQQAGDLGDKMHEQTLEMIEKAHGDWWKKKRPPTIDPKKLMEASERLQKMIEKENADREERLKKLEETSKTLKTASEELLKTAEQMLEDKKKKAMSEAEWRKQGCPVTKPVKVGKPLKLKKPAQ